MKNTTTKRRQTRATPTEDRVQHVTMTMPRALFELMELDRARESARAGVVINRSAYLSGAYAAFIAMKLPTPTLPLAEASLEGAADAE